MSILWEIFIITVVLLLLLDHVFLRKWTRNLGHAAIFGTLINLVATAVFGLLILEHYGSNECMDFFTTYLIELSLSIDNIFVFISIFAYFKLEEEEQEKALLYGIVGAIAMRILFIYAGSALLQRFSWLSYPLGAVLLLSAIRLLRPKRPPRTPSFLLFQTSFPKIRPFILALFAVESADILFAFDSIPAALAITPSFFIVATSNILSIICMRTLYIGVQHLVKRFQYLSYAIAINLGFIGIKMIGHAWWPISSAWSISFIITTLSITLLMSIFKKSSRASGPYSESLQPPLHSSHFPPQQHTKQ